MSQPRLETPAPRIIVYSSLFPSSIAPLAGTFIRERMFRVARRVPLIVVAPQPWSPFDWLIRLRRKSFRLQARRRESMDDIEVHRPRFLSFPGVFKRFDGWLMAKCTQKCVREIHRRFGATVIDAHFLYPDGYAATLIGRELQLPVTITLRGSKDQRLLGTDREPMLRQAAMRASRLISVTASLARDVGVALGRDESGIDVIGNGVDVERFDRKDRLAARRRLGIAADASVLVSVGHLIGLKGFHRVIPLLPALSRQFPKLQYLIVGGGASQGDMTGRLAALAREHGVEDRVRFCGPQHPDELAWYYSAADVFALATEYEGWANVFLEAMACGLPVVATRVGGNAEVVREPDTGTLVDFWDGPAFALAIRKWLENPGSVDARREYARANAWDARVDRLVELFGDIARAPQALPSGAEA